MTPRDFVPQISLTAAAARRIALAAQGFGVRRTAARTPWPRTAAVIGRMGLLQLDSVSALVRAHYLPVFSRIGDYDRGALDRRAFGDEGREFFEYWAHEASLLPFQFYPLMRWRMARAARHIGTSNGFATFGRDQRDYLRAVESEIRVRGPLVARDLADPGKRSGSWWGWNKGKSALEYLFRTGVVTAAGRRGFERAYDLTERALPAPVVAMAAPAEADAIRDLAAFAARAFGVATETDIRDYFRLPVADARRAIGELVEAGTIIPAEVARWRQPAFLASGAAQPSRIAPTALVSPFDPLVWFRPRTERLFDFHYRIELYTPAAKRQFGYYVLPFLHRGRLTARLDLRSDRATGVLGVHGIFAEQGARSDALAAAIAGELRHLARWLDLSEIRIARRGDLAAEVERLV
jgi:uncharacterized protein YcaQ